MVRCGKKNKPELKTETEDDFDNFAHSQVVGFHPHCFNQQLALAESRQFDELYALAHNPVLGENEDEA